MNSNDHKSIPVARALVAALPGFIEQAEAGQFPIAAFMLRLALDEVRNAVGDVEFRCGRILRTNERLGIDLADLVESLS